MGFIGAKCPHCWDRIPCGCVMAKRESSGPAPDTRLASAIEENNRLLAEQNRILKAQRIKRRRKD